MGDIVQPIPNKFRGQAPVFDARVRVDGGCFLLAGEAWIATFKVRETYQIGMLHVNDAGNHYWRIVPLMAEALFIS